ncbi:MAG: C4-type zinc ribbon domain-containing protein [Chloroflexota bacterium]|nr:C4-type zinc ribbon domain-containing protein [Chloroflexota bacterium]MDE2941300.1 C4-type zinc ribbon domain-containing protein [Chloroflexota bacterium]MDE3267768.1 C4-type zinc ribbon domain-containing protein [Chloroflexota bacterium]
MTIAQQLYDLLGVDGELDRCRSTIASIDETLADDRLLRERRRVVEAGRAVLSRQETERRDIELSIGSFQEKGKQLEETLYGGSVRNSRELEGMNKELELLRENQQKHEEGLLRALEAIEDTERKLGRLEDGLREMETAREQQHVSLVDERAQLEAESEALQTRRSGMASQVSPEHLRLYDRMRVARQGQAVSRVERGVCGGCRISLPSRVVQQARTSQRPVQCPSCSRILFVSQ